MKHALSLSAVAALTAVISLTAQSPPAAGEWRAYHGDNRSLRYSPLDQITRANVANLRPAWEIDLARFGPRPEFKNEAAPLYVDGMLYMTAGINRAVVALDPSSGAVRWTWNPDEGERAAKAPRRNSGRGLALRRRPGLRLPAGGGADGRFVRRAPAW